MMCRFMPVERKNSMPSGAAKTQAMVSGIGAPRSARSLQPWASDPPVASIGSSTKQVRPSRRDGSFATYSLGACVFSSRCTPTTAMSASGRSSIAAGNIPRPARKIGTSTGRLASAMPSVSASGVRTRVLIVGKCREASATTTSERRRNSARKN